MKYWMIATNAGEKAEKINRSTKWLIFLVVLIEKYASRYKERKVKSLIISAMEVERSKVNTIEIITINKKNDHCFKRGTFLSFLMFELAIMAAITIGMTPSMAATLTEMGPIQKSLLLVK